MHSTQLLSKYQIFFNVQEIQYNLRSKRFWRAFRRFEVMIFRFLNAQKLVKIEASAKKSVTLAPILAPPKSEKCLELAETPKETLAKQGFSTMHHFIVNTTSLSLSPTELIFSKKLEK